MPHDRRPPTVYQLDRRLSSLEMRFEMHLEETERLRQEWTPVLRELVDESRVAREVGKQLRTMEARGWSRRERLIALAGLLVVAGNFALTLADRL